MTTMIAELYDALLAAGSPQDKARAAAAAMVEHAPDRPRFDRIEADIAELKSDVATLKADVADLKRDVTALKADVATLKADFADLKRDVTALKADNLLMKWMLGFLLAFQIAIFIKLFLH